LEATLSRRTHYLGSSPLKLLFTKLGTTVSFMPNPVDELATKNDRPWCCISGEA